MILITLFFPPTYPLQDTGYYTCSLGEHLLPGGPDVAGAADAERGELSNITFFVYVRGMYNVYVADAATKLIYGIRTYISPITGRHIQGRMIALFGGPLFNRGGAVGSSNCGSCSSCCWGWGGGGAVCSQILFGVWDPSSLDEDLICFIKNNIFLHQLLSLFHQRRRSLNKVCSFCMYARKGAARDWRRDGPRPLQSSPVSSYPPSSSHHAF